MKIFLTIGHVVFLAVYAALAAALTRYYREFSLPEDKAGWIVKTFVITSAIFAAASTVLLFII